MSKLLYTIGDSWTYGTELDNPEMECYPYLLSQKLGYELVNEALPGSSNDWMFRKCIEWISQRDSFDDITVVVGWSNPNRREENFGFVWGGHISYWEDWEWREVDDKHRYKSKFISEHLFDETLFYKKSITYILTLQEFLKSKNIKYLFYDPFVNILIRDDWYYKRFKSGSTVDKIYEKIDKRFYVGPKIDGRCAIEELDEYHINQSERHPNKNEHEWIAEALYRKITELEKLKDYLLL